MRITELFTAQSIALDEALQTQEQILSRLVELQATHGNITDKEAYKKALYAREAEGSTYVDNGITVPHAKTDVVTRPSLAALRLASPVQYNAEDTNAQKAARWAVEQELLKDDTSEDEQKFHPAFPVSKLRVCLTWEKAKQKGLFDQNTEA